MRNCCRWRRRLAYRFFCTCHKILADTQGFRAALCLTCQKPAGAIRLVELCGIALKNCLPARRMSGRANRSTFPAAAPTLRRQPLTNAAPPCKRVTSRRYSRPICGGSQWRRPVCSVSARARPRCAAHRTASRHFDAVAVLRTAKDAPLRFFASARQTAAHSFSKAAVSTGITAPACRRKARYTAACAAAYHSRRKARQTCRSARAHCIIRAASAVCL